MPSRLFHAGFSESNGHQDDPQAVLGYEVQPPNRYGCANMASEVIVTPWHVGRTPPGKRHIGNAQVVLGLGDPCLTTL